jgi:hypothetical protein
MSLMPVQFWPVWVQSLSLPSEVPQSIALPIMSPFIKSLKKQNLINSAYDAALIKLSWLKE